MPRPPLDEDTKREVTIRLIRAAQSIIFSEGLEAVTIRKIAKIAKVNSAILYKYFQDLDELLLFANTDLLKDYTRDLIIQSQNNTMCQPKSAYLQSWKLFCHYSFKYPECMNHLFFCKHSDDLERIIQSYYDLFSEQLEEMNITLSAMICSGNLYQRNSEVLQLLFTGHISKKRIDLINDLTVSYYHMLLNEKISGGDAIDNNELTKRMLYACRQTLLISYGIHWIQNHDFSS
jgi:AcrR family transcriptional regulator